MTRKVRFRGFDLDSKGWIVGGSLLRKEAVYNKGKLIERGTDYIATGIQYNDLDLHIVDATSVGQYVGQSDIEGTDIYEDDILTSFTGRNYAVYYNHFKSAFCLRTQNPEQPDEPLTKELVEKLKLKVAGNMYENQGLMKLAM